jgi:GNAT superfamily N-acetyltransferase
VPGLTFVAIQSVPKSARAAFSCGTEALDRYFHSLAKQDAKRSIAATFVLMRDRDVLGYYTLSVAEIDAGELPAGVLGGLPRYPMLPATRLGRLAVDKRFQRQGWGEYLLIDAMHRAFENTQIVGSVALIVDVKEDARDFYLRFGFIEFPETRNKMFLPMQTIRQLLEVEDSTRTRAIQAAAHPEQPF